MTSILRRLVAGLLVVVLAGCGAGLALPTDVGLDVLVQEQEAWDGRLVVVQGVVAGTDDPVLHHWVQDEAQNRVALLPDDEAYADLVGATVRVEGRYRFLDDRGRVIEVDRLEVLDGG